MTRLSVLDAAGFAKYVDASVEIYVVAMGKSREVVPARRSITARHLDHPGLRAVVARNDDGLIGFGYGYHGEPGQWWHDAVMDALNESDRRQWLADAYEVAELHVLPAWQGQGLGRRLLLDLCRDVARSTVVLSAIDRETPARRLYRSVGLVDVLTGFTFTGSAERYAVMAGRLPLIEA
ncbi:MAG: GNAT family N-acetyltransferase [Actinomycetes bacterium]